MEGTFSIPDYSLGRCLYSLQQKGMLCDVELECQEGTISVHKVVLLSSGSTYFQKLLQLLKSGNAGTQLNIDMKDYNLRIDMKEYSIQTVNILIETIYTGQLTVKKERIEELINLCNFFGLENFRSTIQNFFKEDKSWYDYCKTEVYDIEVNQMNPREVDADASIAMDINEPKEDAKLLLVMEVTDDEDEKCGVRNKAKVHDEYQQASAPTFPPLKKRKVITEVSQEKIDSAERKIEKEVVDSAVDRSLKVDDHCDRLVKGPDTDHSDRLVKGPDTDHGDSSDKVADSDHVDNSVKIAEHDTNSLTVADTYHDDSSIMAETEHGDSSVKDPDTDLGDSSVKDSDKDHGDNYEKKIDRTENKESTDEIKEMKEKSGMKDVESSVNRPAKKSNKGIKAVLDKFQRAKLASCFKTLIKLGYNYNVEQFCEIASHYAFNLKKRKHNQPLTKHWFYGFLAGNTEVKELRDNLIHMIKTQSENLALSDSHFHSYYLSLLKKYSLEDKPHLVYSFTSIDLAYKPPYFVKEILIKADLPREERVSLFCCANGIGETLPPYFIFQESTKIDGRLEKLVQPGCGHVVDHDAYNAEIFLHYLKNFFVNHTADDQMKILLIDGHSLYVTVDVMEWTTENNISLLVLPADSSHQYQPLEGECLSQFEKEFLSECKERMQPQSNKLDKETLLGSASVAYKAAFTRERIQKSFK